VDIAVDPLEGTNLCANGLNDALAVVAMAEHGQFLNAPDTYMDKIAVGPSVGRGVVDIRRTPTENLRAVADTKRVAVSDLTVVILDRPRHGALVAEVRATGARIRLISDGDVGGAIATSDPATGIDVLMGIGGAPEGVLAAAALRCTGGDFQGVLKPRNPDEAARAARMGIADIEHVFSIEELASGDVMFAATGVTDGFLLRGVRYLGDGAETHSVVTRSRSGTVRFIRARHRFQQRPNYAPAAPPRSKTMR
jgi:fructose-1,6-bisphosphatase II